MYSIHLSNVQLTGRHGVYPGEQLLDAPYEVNIVCRFTAAAEQITALEETVNYETVYELLLHFFRQPYPMLETLAYDLAAAIRNQFPHIYEMDISIEKLAPPISGIRGRVGVSYQWSGRQPSA